MTKHYLFVSDFDQTLSFNDSGRLLSETLGITGFEEKVAGLSRLNLVQSGAELTYLLRHDPEYRRRVRRRRPRGSRPTDPPQGQHRTTRVAPQQGHRRLPVRLLRRIRGARGDRACRAREHRAAEPHHRHSAQLRSALRRDLVGGERRCRLRKGDRARNAPHRAGRSARARRLRWRREAPTSTSCCTSIALRRTHHRRVAGHGRSPKIARRTVMSDDALSVLVPILEEIAKYSDARRFATSSSSTDSSSRSGTGFARTG